MGKKKKSLKHPELCISYEEVGQIVQFVTTAKESDCTFHCGTHEAHLFEGYLCLSSSYRYQAPNRSAFLEKVNQFNQDDLGSFCTVTSTGLSVRTSSPIPDRSSEDQVRYMLKTHNYGFDQLLERLLSS